MKDTKVVRYLEILEPPIYEIHTDNSSLNHRYSRS